MSTAEPVAEKRAADEIEAPGDDAAAAAAQQQPQAKKAKTAAVAPSIPIDQLQEMTKGELDQAPAAGPAANAPTLTEEIDPCMYYPRTYGNLKEENIVSRGEPMNSSKGNGQMLWIETITPAGERRGLCIQAPKLFLPAGISAFASNDDSGSGNSKVNALCSFGTSWAQNVQMVAFRELIDNVVTPALIRLIMAHNMHLPYCTTAEAVKQNFSPIIYVSEQPDKKDPSKIKTYPPCMKLNVGLNASNKTVIVDVLPPPANCTPKELEEYTKNPRYTEISYSSVGKGSSIIPMISVDWIYRKKRNSPTGWTFSAHLTIYQAVHIRESQRCNAAALGKVVVQV